ADPREDPAELAALVDRVRTGVERLAVPVPVVGGRAREGEAAISGASRREREAASRRLRILDDHDRARLVVVGDGAGHAGAEGDGDRVLGGVEGAAGGAAPLTRGAVPGARVGALGEGVALAREHVVRGADRRVAVVAEVAPVVGARGS